MQIGIQLLDRLLHQKYLLYGSGDSGGFWFLAHVPCQVLLQGVEFLALPLHCHPGELNSPQVLSQSICWLQVFTFCQSSLLNYVLLHLNVSLSKYCAQSPTRSPHASLSPSHPGCQFIVAFWAEFLVSLPGILPQNASLKYMLSMFAWIRIGHNSNGEKYWQKFAHRYIHIIFPIHSFHNWMQHNLSCDCEHGRHCLDKALIMMEAEHIQNENISIDFSSLIAKVTIKGINYAFLLNWTFFPSLLPKGVSRMVLFFFIIYTL